MNNLERRYWRRIRIAIGKAVGGAITDEEMKTLVQELTDLCMEAHKEGKADGMKEWGGEK